MTNRWVTSKTAVYNLSYHIIWCTKYRRKVITGEIETRLKELITVKANEMNIKLKAMEVMPDHIHIFVSALPSHSPQHIIQQIKGYTSRILRQEFRELTTKIPSLWTRSYYIDTAGKINEQTIMRYVENQKNK